MKLSSYRRLRTANSRLWTSKFRRKAPALERLEDRQCLSNLGVDDPVITPALSAVSQGKDAGQVQAQLSRAYGQLPLSFEINQGQADPQVDFLSHGSGYGLFLTPAEAVLSLSKGSGVANQPPGVGGQESPSGDVLRLQLLGADPAAQVVGLDRLSSVSNYLIGNDPSRWHTNIANYGKVEYQNVYPGVDLVYYGCQRQLEYDFVVAPGADPAAIRLSFAGAQGMTLDDQSNLVLHTAGGDVIEQAPIVYQQAGGTRQMVAGHFVLGNNGQVTFAVAAHDKGLPLVIDPILVYSTYLGGSGYDSGQGIAVDSAGNAYVTGYTGSFDFPTANPLQRAFAFGYYHAFVAKLNAAGSALVYSTYLGGSGEDIGQGIAVDSAGNAYVTGDTKSTDFPITNPLQSANGGGTDAFVAKLNAAGSALVYSTYLGGTGEDAGYGIAVDAAGNAYVTGDTTSTDFPTPAGAFQTVLSGNRNAFVAKLNPSLSGAASLVYATYLGGSGYDSGLGIAVDSAGNAYVTGRTYSSTNFPTTVGAFQTVRSGTVNAFVAKLNPSLSGAASLVYATYLGGSGYDQGQGIAVDSAGNAYVTGYTTSTNFPTTNPLQSANGGGIDAFVTKLNAAGSALVYSTYLGGSGYDQGQGIAVDSAGNAYVTGYTNSTNFPTAKPLQSANGGGFDAFVAMLNAAGSALVHSTYLGGSGYDQGLGIAVDADGNAYVTGDTRSTDFPTTNPLQRAIGGGGDAFVAKIVVPHQISGTVFQDVNTNGVQDPGEPGLAGQTLFLDLHGSGTLQADDPTASTDASGNFQFTVQGPGPYTVRQVLLGGVLLNKPATGSYQLTVASGANVTGQNFADVPTSIAVPLTLPPSTPFPRQGNANADYVEALYRAILDRDAEPGGLAIWTNALDSGALSRLQVVQGIRQSPEHFTQEVTDFYYTLLNRPPDPQGLQVWVQALESGVLKEEQIAFFFLDSPEYLSKGDKYFVDHMYLSLLGRPFDAAGEAHWLDALGDDLSGNPTHAASATHEQAITDFLYSQESLTRLVQGYYQVFLQRLADPFGLNSWLSALQNGASFLTIGQDFLSSGEFYNQAAAEG